MRFLMAVIVLVCMGTQAHAQSDKAACEAKIEAVAAMAANFRLVANAVKSAKIGAITSGLAGDEQAASEAVAAANIALRPHLDDYLAKLDDLAYSLQTCAR